MTDDISAALSWFANYTNFYSVLSVLLCFVAMVVFILRLNGENFMSSSATHYVTVKEQSMMKIHNPFSVQLDKNKCSSLKDGLHLQLCMELTSKVKILWGVDIQAFQKELQKSSNEIAGRFDSDTVFDLNFKQSETLAVMSGGDGNKCVFIKCPEEVTEETLGEPPRVTYPVVIIACLSSIDVPSDITRIVLQFTVVHLKDSQCNLDSHIVYQFVKTNLNKIISLQPIFMSTSEASSPNDVPNNSVKNSHSNQSPIVTHSASVSQGDEGQGQNLNDSDVGFQHCDSCGKIQQCFKSILKTREHEICSCEHDEADNDKVNINVNCGKFNTFGENKDMSQEDNNRPEMLEKGVPNCGIIEDNNENKSTGVGDVKDSNSDEDGGELCCVCQSLAVFFALLPCRHACVCNRCVSLLDKCPICRGFIESYFRISDRPEVEEWRPVEDEGENIGPRLNGWQALNQRLNEMLGFT